MLQKTNPRASDLFLIFGLLLISNISAALHVVWLDPQFVITELIFWSLLAGFSVRLMKKHGDIQNFIVYCGKNWIILPFLIFSGLSIFWSVYWQISLYRWLILFYTILTGGYVGLRCDTREFLKILSVFGAFILFVSYGLVFFMPHIGVMNYYTIQGAWKGIYWHKNHMGLISTFVNILFLINIVDSSQSKMKRTILWGLLYILSLVFVIQSDSVAAYITTLVLHGAIFIATVLLKFRRIFRPLHYFAFIAAALTAFVVLYNYSDLVLELFNRNATLTGRIPMWAHLHNSYIGKRPFGGYGFNAFWYLDSHRVAMQHAAGYPDPIVIADNGFIDILANTGYGGLFLFSIFYFGLWWSSARYAYKAKDIYGLLPVILMSYTLLANISWSLIFENESFFMLIMISVMFCITDRTPNPVVADEM